MRHNPLSTYICENINAFESAMKQKIANWHVMIANHNVKIETFDKRQLSIQGVDYSGTLVTQYWSFFDPFIQDYISTKSEEIRIKSIDMHIDTQIDIANRYKSCKRKEFILEHMSWWISIIVLLGGFLCKKMGWIEFGNWLRNIQDNF